MLKNRFTILVASAAVAALTLSGCAANEAKPKATPTTVVAETVVNATLEGKVKIAWSAAAGITGQLGQQFLAANTVLESGESTEYALFASGDKAAAVYKPFATSCLNKALTITPIFEGVTSPKDGSVNGLLYAGMGDDGKETVYGYANKGDVYAVAYKTYDNLYGFSVGIVDGKKALEVEYRGRFDKTIEPLTALKSLVEMNYKNRELAAVNVDTKYVFETLTTYGYSTGFGSLRTYGLSVEQLRKIIAGSYNVADYDAPFVYNFEDKSYYAVVEKDGTKSLVNTVSKKVISLDNSCV